MEKTISVTDEIINSACENLHFLILHNDDINSIEYIISKLIQILKVELDEASKFAIEAHIEGSTYIKEGTFEELEVLHNNFGDSNITTSID